MVKLDSKTVIIIALSILTISSVAFALNTYFNTGSFLVHVQPAPGINSTTVSVSPFSSGMTASAGQNYSQAVCFTNKATTPVTVFFNYSVSPPLGGSFSDIVWEIPASIVLGGSQTGCTNGYPVIVSPNAVSGDYNVSVTYSWTG